MPKGMSRYSGITSLYRNVDHGQTAPSHIKTATFRSISIVGWSELGCANVSKYIEVRWGQDLDIELTAALLEELATTDS